MALFVKLEFDQHAFSSRVWEQVKLAEEEIFSNYLIFKLRRNDNNYLFLLDDNYFKTMVRTVFKINRSAGDVNLKTLNQSEQVLAYRQPSVGTFPTSLSSSRMW